MWPVEQLIKKIFKIKYIYKIFYFQGTDSLMMEMVRPPLPTTPIPILTSTPSLPLLTMDMIPPQTQLPEMETFSVEIQKDSHGLGITIAGYVCEKGNKLLV